MPVFYRTAEVALGAARRRCQIADGNNYAAVAMPADFIILDGRQRRLSAEHLKNAYGIFSWNQKDNPTVRIDILSVFYQDPADAQETVDRLRTLADGNNYAAVIMPIDFIVSPERPDDVVMVISLRGGRSGVIPEGAVYVGDRRYRGPRLLELHSAVRRPGG